MNNIIPLVILCTSSCEKGQAELLDVKCPVSEIVRCCHLVLYFKIRKILEAVVVPEWLMGKT
jgi:hypothetical protein